MPFLRVFSPDDARTPPRDVPMDMEVYTLGRERDNAIVLEGQASSRHHARIRKALEGWIVEDLGSSHGTVLGGVRVNQQVLRDGDVFLLGDSRIEFHETPRVPVPAALMPGQDPVRTVPPLGPLLPPALPPMAAVPPPLPTPRPASAGRPPAGKGLLLAILAGGGLLLLGGLGAAAWFLVPSGRAHGGMAPEVRPGSEAPPGQPGVGALPAGSPESGSPPPITVPPPVAPPASAPAAQSALVQDLVISEVRLVDTPQVGSMRACILAECGGRQARYHRAREYPESENVTLPVQLRLRDVHPGEIVRLKVRLDDDEARVCGPEAEDQTTVEFSVGREGLQRFTQGRWILEVRASLVTAGRD